VPTARVNIASLFLILMAVVEDLLSTSPKQSCKVWRVHIQTLQTTSRNPIFNFFGRISVGVKEVNRIASFHQTAPVSDVGSLGEVEEDTPPLAIKQLVHRPHPLQLRVGEDVDFVAEDTANVAIGQRILFDSFQVSTTQSCVVARECL